LTLDNDYESATIPKEGSQKIANKEDLGPIVRQIVDIARFSTNPSKNILKEAFVKVDDMFMQISDEKLEYEITPRGKKVLGVGICAVLGLGAWWYLRAK
jgi:hypothetical protein